MEPIEILSCLGCQRIHDNLTFQPRCPRCNTQYFKRVEPSKWILFKWFITQPKHVIKLLIQDIREKYQ